LNNVSSIESGFGHQDEIMATLDAWAKFNVEMPLTAKWCGIFNRERHIGRISRWSWRGLANLGES